MADGALSPIILVNCLIPIFAPKFGQVTFDRGDCILLYFLGRTGSNFGNGSLSLSSSMFQLTSLYSTDRNIYSYDFQVRISSLVSFYVRLTISFLQYYDPTWLHGKLLSLCDVICF